MTISERLKSLRGKKTLEEFAHELGINYQNIQRYENGRMPSAEFLLLLHARGINIVWVLTGEGEPYNKKAPQDDSQGVPQEDMVEVGGIKISLEEATQIQRDTSGWRDLLIALLTLYSESPPEVRRFLEAQILSALQLVSQFGETQRAKRRVDGGRAAG